MDVPISRSTTLADYPAALETPPTHHLKQLCASSDRMRRSSIGAGPSKGTKIQMDRLAQNDSGL